ncbi:MAG: hypothetical protein LUH21_12055 [Clostridiales bacterium]|nr:hypothetical protein [Clostridiales bacterium]
MYYTILNLENYETVTKDWKTQKEDIEKVHGHISAELNKCHESGLEKSTFNLYKQVLRKGLQRLKPFRLHLNNTFKVPIEENAISPELSENDLDNIKTIILEAKDWYHKLSLLLKSLEQTPLIPSKTPGVVLTNGTFLCALYSAYQRPFSLYDMLFL